MAKFPPALLYNQQIPSFQLLYHPFEPNSFTLKTEEVRSSESWNRCLLHGIETLDDHNLKKQLVGTLVVLRTASVHDNIYI